ncbi:MAG: carbohydrate porin, partial [Thermoguttaceae bacterium]
MRLMSQWALADGNPSPNRWSFNVALQGQGLIRGRKLDTLGVGYFYDQLSSDFKRLVSTLPTVDLEDVQGVELYYNAAIRPWLRLTGDLQIIDNENVGNDPAFVLGLRAKIAL